MQTRLLTREYCFLLFAEKPWGKVVVLSASIVFLRITDLMSAGEMFADYSLGRVRNSAQGTLRLWCYIMAYFKHFKHTTYLDKLDCWLHIKITTCYAFVLNLFSPEMNYFIFSFSAFLHFSINRWPWVPTTNALWTAGIKLLSVASVVLIAFFRSISPGKLKCL